jgi:hypothetical protein
MPDTNLPAVSKPSGTSLWSRMRPRLLLIILLLVILYLGLNVWIYFYGTKIFNFNLSLKNTAQNVSVLKQQEAAHFPVPTPRPTRIPRIVFPLPTGAQSWKFSGGAAGAQPKLKTVTVNPLTPSPDDTQTVSITAACETPMSAAATITTDNKQQTAPMKLTAGSATAGTWSVSWNVKDTYRYVYKIDFVLTGAAGQWTGGLAFR